MKISYQYVKVKASQCPDLIFSTSEPKTHHEELISTTQVPQKDPISLQRISEVTENNSESRAQPGVHWHTPDQEHSDSGEIIIICAARDMNFCPHLLFPCYLGSPTF